MPVPNPGFSSGASPVHKPALLREVIQLLDLSPGMTVVDGTVGAGGHSQEILKKIKEGGTLVGLDRDSMMLAHASNRLAGPQVYLKQSSYLYLADVVSELGMDQVDRMLLDLGLSSDQLADGQRGFSYTSSGPLDLRFDTTTGLPAWKWLKKKSQQQIADVLTEYGEERFSDRIASQISNYDKPIKSAAELTEIVTQAIPAAALKDSRKHPATRVFQALRIAVNKELEHLHQTLTNVLPQVIKPGGKVVIITFHSLEDRMVKECFKDKHTWHNLTPKPIAASTAEKRINPRCRSAKVRAAEKQ